VSPDPQAATHTIVSSVAQIDPGEWRRLFGDSPEGYDYYGTLEASRLEGFGFCYVLVRSEGRVQLIAPLFWSDLDLAIGIEGAARAAVSAARRLFPRLLVVRTLFCGSPFGEEGALGIETGCARGRSLLSELVRAMEGVCREKALAFMMFKDFPERALPLLEPLVPLGFMRGDSFPNVVVPLPYGTMDGYLASLSRNARKDLRRKVKKALADGPIEARVADNVDDVIDRVYELYLNTFEAGTVRFEKLSQDYFIEVGRRLRSQARFFLFHVDGRLVCFNLCFLHGDRLIDKFIGMDYGVARKLNLYFYTWHHNVQWCVENGVRFYQVGQTDHEAKVHLGGTLVPLYFHARHNNPLVNAPLRMAARFLAPRPPAVAQPSP